MTSNRTRNALLESLVLAGLLLLGNALFFAEHPGFTASYLHPGLLPIALVSFRYGFRGAAMSVPSLAIAHWAALTVLGDGSLPIDMLQGENGTLVAYFCIVGALCGGLAHGHIGALDSARRQTTALVSRANQLASELEALRNTNTQLAARVVDAKHTIPALARISRQLHRNPGSVPAALGPMIREVVFANAVSVWSGTPLQCIARWGATATPASADSIARLAPALVGGGTLGIEQIPRQQRDTTTPFLVGCFGSANSPYYVAVDEIDMNSYGQTRRELFDVLVEWAHDLTESPAAEENRTPAQALPLPQPVLRTPQPPPPWRKTPSAPAPAAKGTGAQSAIKTPFELPRPEKPTPGVAKPTAAKPPPPPTVSELKRALKPMQKRPFRSSAPPPVPLALPTKAPRNATQTASSDGSVVPGELIRLLASAAEAARNSDTRATAFTTSQPHDSETELRQLFCRVCEQFARQGSHDDHRDPN